MRQFEFPYNFDKKLLYILQTFTTGDDINCIYLPPYLKDYQTILRTAEQADQLDRMSRQEYEEHLNFINSLFPNKIQILLQKADILLNAELVKYYISLGVKNFCVASIEQAKIIKQIDSTINIVGSIAMQITQEKIKNNLQEFSLYFDSFVLPFSASRKLLELKKFPRNFNYILLINSLCSIKCNGKNHWNFDYKEDKDIFCPGKLGEIPWNESAKIRPMDLGFFDPYITVYKIQDRGWPTEDIIRDYILYTTNYNDLPGIIYNTSFYNAKTNCYMTFTDEQYLPCVIRQAQRIKYLNSKYEYIVMVDENDLVSQEKLKENNIHYILIKQELFIKKRSHFQKTFNKFKIIDYLDKYEKICWLDADTILTKNIDYLFDEMSVDCQFLGSIDNNLNKIEGGVFIISDKIDLDNFKIQLHKSQLTDSNDEDFLNSYFKLQSNINLRYTTLPHSHFAGYIKIFNYQIFPQIKKIFYELSDLNFNKYFDVNLNKIIEITYRWNNFINSLNSLEEIINE